MQKRFERPTVDQLREAADTLLYGEWVPRSPHTVGVSDTRETLRDFLDLNATVGSVGRAFLAQEGTSDADAERFVTSLIVEAVRLYSGVLHYTYGTDIADELSEIMPKRGLEHGKDS